MQKANGLKAVRSLFFFYGLNQEVRYSHFPVVVLIRNSLTL